MEGTVTHRSVKRNERYWRRDSYSAYVAKSRRTSATRQCCCARLGKWVYLILDSIASTECHRRLAHCQHENDLEQYAPLIRLHVLVELVCLVISDYLPSRSYEVA